MPSQEPSRECSEKIVQMNFLIWVAFPPLRFVEHLMDLKGFRNCLRLRPVLLSNVLQCSSVVRSLPLESPGGKGFLRNCTWDSQFLTPNMYSRILSPKLLSEGT